MRVDKVSFSGGGLSLCNPKICNNDKYFMYLPSENKIEQKLHDNVNSITLAAVLTALVVALINMAHER